MATARLSMLTLALCTAISGQELDKASKFRSGLIGGIYDKAALRLPTQEAHRLLKDLRALDNLYMEAKSLDLGPDKVLKELRALLAAHKCADIFDALHAGGKHDFKPVREPVDEHGGVTTSAPGDSEQWAGEQFYDPRVTRIWSDALLAGRYTKEELGALLEELRHYDERASELHERHKEAERAGNDVHEERDNAVSADSEQRAEKRRLNAQLRQIEEDVVAAQFRSPRAKELWLQAARSGMDDGELEIMREELSHFDRTLEKLSHFSQMAGGGVDQKSDKHASDKVASLGRKVDKHEQLIASRLRHVEL